MSDRFIYTNSDMDGIKITKSTMGNSTPHLVKLLADTYKEGITQTDLEHIFDSIAIELLRQIKIVTLKHHFYIRELEFYFYSDRHPDTYAHKHKRQLEFGEWYFHRFTDIVPFMNSNRNGLDITFGDKTQNIFGGILIRKIQNRETKELVVGINKVARALITNIGEQNINALALETGQKAFNKKDLLHLEEEENNHSTPVYKTQRNGLSYKEGEIEKHYYKSSYCYYNHDLNVSQITEVQPAK